jgi:hypothetical protein
MILLNEPLKFLLNQILVDNKGKIYIKNHIYKSISLLYVFKRLKLHKVLQIPIQSKFVIAIIFLIILIN